MSKHYPPEFAKKDFHCPNCGVHASQEWFTCERKDNYLQKTYKVDSVKFSICNHCTELALWVDKRLMIPEISSTQTPHVDLPDSCLKDYNEARSIVGKSPKAAAALLRLCIQKLMKELGEDGKNINSDIKSLVMKGLPVQVQKALDICRVVGNEAVHPGTINVDDDAEIVYSLFGMINYIVQNQITQSKEIYELYNKLPEENRHQIEQRDNGNK